MRTIQLAWLIALLCLLGCEDRSTSPPPTLSLSPRIVSMSPAFTQILLDLGAGDEIVGVGAFDPLAERYEVVGDLYRFEYEKLLAVEPTLLLIQPPADGVPAKLRELAEPRGWALHTRRIETVADVLNAIHNETDGGIGKAVGRADEAQALRARVKATLDAIAALTGDRPAPRTLVLVGLTPITAAGPGTFIDELLTIAGGQNVLTGPAHLYPVLDRERIVALAPDVVITIDTAPPDPAAGARIHTPAALQGLDIPAVRDRRHHWLAHRQALLPSSSMPQVAAVIASLLHPDLREPVNAIMAE